MISKNMISFAVIAAIALLMSHPVPAGAAELPAAPASALIEKAGQGKLPEPEWVKALQSEDRLLREAAVSLALRGEGAAFIPSAETMSRLDSETRMQLVSVLGMRGNPAARDAVRPSLNAPDPAERIAAALAAGELQDPAAKDRLIELALSDDPAAETARQALPWLADDGIDEALMEVFRDSPSERQKRALQALAARGHRAAVPVLLASGWLDDPVKSKTATEVLAALATDDDFGPLLEKSIALSGPARTNLNRALAAIILTSDNPRALLAALKLRIAREEVPTRQAYIALHSSVPSEASVEALAEYARDADPDIAKRAVMSLAAWENEGSAETLLALASSDNEMVRQSAAKALSVLMGRGRTIRDPAVRKRIGDAIKRAASAPSAAPAQAAGGGRWVPLFNGKDLAGWHALPGGTWFVRDGQLVGTSTKAEKRHGLLVSDKRYRDFRLRVEFMSLVGNSGLYFRTEKVDSPVGVKGFQAEICPPGAPAGGLYETLGRKWVAHSDKERVNSVFQKNGWNRMEVVAVGGDIEVRINGEKVCEVKDDPGLPEGHIALQLHGGQDMDVRFRNVEIQEITP